jgi:hypothetical protein
MTWNDARAFCLSMGHDLPSIKSAAQNQAIVAALSAGVTGELSIHIGASDSAQEGSFVWPDVSPLTYTNWYASQPNDSWGAQDCVELFLGSTVGVWTNTTGLWNDIECASLAAHVVCAAGNGTPAGGVHWALGSLQQSVDQ